MQFNAPNDELMRVIQRMARDYVAGRLGGVPSSSQGLLQPYSQTPVYVTNDSGGEIPAWACMQATGTVEVGGQNYVQVDKPADNDGSAGWFLFNGPFAIADGENGVAQPYAVVRAFKNTGTITAGEKWQPVSGQWYIEQDDAGIFVAIGADDIGTDVFKVFTGVSGGAIDTGDFITDLRLNGNDLQYYTANGGWQTWHTATTCPSP